MEQPPENSFVAGLQEGASESNGHWLCPCNNNSDTTHIHVPQFVGQDYFCETGVPTGSRWSYFPRVVYYDDPLWDGNGCGPNSTGCCKFNNPPWFCKQVPEDTTDDIEIRICVHVNYEDVPIELIEIFVQ